MRKNGVRGLVVTVSQLIAEGYLKTEAQELDSDWHD